MDARKIQSVGGGTYTVSLPKEWTESHGLDAGDVVNLHTHIDGLLVIQPDGTAALPERATVRVDADATESITPTVRAAYAAGATEVIVRAAEGSFTAAQRRVIERTVRNLTGASVAEEADARIVVRTPLDPAEVSVRQSVRQLKYVALSMHRDATAVLTDGASPERLTDRDEQADRLYALIERSFVRGLARLDEVDALGVTRPELFELWLTARELERVADHAERLAAVADAPTPADPAASSDGTAAADAPAEDRIETVAQRARDIVADAVGVVVGDHGVETARRVLIDRDRVRDRFDAVGDPDDVAATPRPARSALAAECVRRTAEHGGNVAELALQSAIRRGELTEPPRESPPGDTPS